MRVSIWQQFSSNHSASYTVVGKFTDKESTDRAAGELNGILAQLKDWWRHKLLGTLSTDWLVRAETGELTPLEQDWSRHYDIEWRGINWYYWVWGDETFKPVTTYKEFLFVRSPHYHIWYGPQPFNRLLERFGAEVWVESQESQSYANTDLIMVLTGDAPDEATAQQLEQECLDYLTTVNDEREIGIPPWIGCYTGTCAEDADDLKFHAAVYFSEMAANSIGWKLYRGIENAHNRREHDLEATLRQRYNELYSSGQIMLTLEQIHRVNAAFSTTAVDTLYPPNRPIDRHVRRAGTYIELQGLRFSHPLPEPLVAILVWLETFGCTNLTFSFDQIPNTVANYAAS